MDPDDLATLVRTDGDQLLRFAYQLTHDRAGAQDLVQEALALFLAHDRREKVLAPVPYLRRMVLNEFLRVRRRHSSGEVVMPEPPEPRPDGGGHGEPTETLAAKDEMWRALEQLRPRQRAVLVLRYYLDQSDAEIATLLGCRPATVRSLAARGLTSLRAALPELIQSEVTP